MTAESQTSFDAAVKGVRSASITKSAVMGPLLLLDLIAFGAAAGSSLRSEVSELQWAIYGFALFLGVVTLAVYLWLLWKKPHLLQSDRYQILEMLSRRVGDSTAGVQDLDVPMKLAPPEIAHARPNELKIQPPSAEDKNS